MLNKLSSKLIVTLFLSLFCTAVVSQSVQTSTVLIRSYQYAAANTELEYRLFVPSSYDSASESPLIVLLHGLGSNPEQVIGYEGIQEEAEKHGYIVVAPYGYNERGWYGSMSEQALARFRPEGVTDPENMAELSEQDVMNVLGIIREEFSIDAGRTYLMGHSMGGGGTYHIGMKYAENWAALAPMAPAIYVSPDELEKIEDTPIIVVQGDEDELVSVNIARSWVAKMKELGMTHKYIEIPGGDHVQAITENPEMIAQIFDFFNENTK